MGSLAHQGSSECTRKITGNMKTLIVTIVLFFVITFAQIIVSLVANSSALLVDSVAMGVDTLLYVGNLIAECIKEKPKRQEAQLWASGLSFVGLICVCIWGLAETGTGIAEGSLDLSNCTFNATTLVAIEGQEQCCTTPTDDDVDAIFVLAFAIFGVIFDAATFAVFKYCTAFKNLESKDTKDDEMDDNNNTPTSEKDSKDTTDDASSSRTRCVNMISALSHVGADFLRSITTMVLGIVLLVTPCSYEKGDFMDSIAGFVISIFIVVGVIPPLWMWVKELKEYLHQSKLQSTYKSNLVSGSSRPTTTANFEEGYGEDGAHGSEIELSNRSRPTSGVDVELELQE